MRQLRLLSILTSLLFSLTAGAQSSVFIIVDISGSGPAFDTKMEGKEIVKELCQGRFDQNKHPLWKWQPPVTAPLQDIVNGRTVPLLDPAKSGILVIMPAGLKDTYKRYKMQKIQNLQNDFMIFFEQAYPSSFSEAWTFIDIARAKTASIAKGQGLSDYYLIEVSDMGYDTGSQDPLYTSEERNTLAQYGSSSSSTTKLGTLYYEGPASKNYQIIVSRINVQQININPTTPAPANVERKNLEIIRPKSISRKKPDDNKSTSLSVIWKCLGCADTTVFSVRATYIGGGKRVTPVVVKAQSSQASLTFKEPGVYKISVSGDGVIAKPAYVKIGEESSGGGGLLLLFLLAAIGGFIYYFFSRSRQIDRTPQEVSNRSRPSRRMNKGEEDAQTKNDSYDLF